MPAYAASVSEPALLRRCRSCGGTVLGALSDGLQVEADLAALTDVEQTAAAILGLHTYAAHRLGTNRLMLWVKDRWTGAGDPVVIEHRCPDPGGRALVELIGEPEPVEAAHLTGWQPPAAPGQAPPF